MPSKQADSTKKRFETVSSFPYLSSITNYNNSLAYHNNTQN
jgi:hypothetical protein